MLDVTRETPVQYIGRIQRATEAVVDLGRDKDTLLYHLRRAGRLKASSFGRGWTAARAFEAICAIAQKQAPTEPEPEIIAYRRDDGIAFTQDASREAVENPVADFEALDAIYFEGPVAEQLGVGVVPTGGRTLREFWKLGRGSEAVRAFLARFAQEAVDEQATSVHFLDLGERLQQMEQEAPEMTDGQAPGFILAREEGDRFDVLKRTDFESEDAAKQAAMAAVTEKNPNILLAAFAGTGTEGKESGRPIYRGISRFMLTGEEPGEEPDEPEAAEAIERAVESLTEPWAGTVREASGEREWDIVVIQAGLSKNRNFWPAELLASKGLAAFEGAPLELLEQEITTGKQGHLGVDVIRRFPDGIVGVVAGQVMSLSWIPDQGGMKPNAKEARAIAKRIGKSPEWVYENSRGMIVGKALTDETFKGKEAESLFASREATGTNLGLSIDSNEASAIPVEVGGGAPLLYRADINEQIRNAVTVVTHPSAGGAVVGRAA